MELSFLQVYYGFVCMYVLRLNVPANSYGHVRMVSLPNHLKYFSLDKLDYTVNYYFVNILSLIGQCP